MRTRAQNGAPERFLLANVNCRDDECLVWPYAIDAPTGYGILVYQGRRRKAHNLVCELAHGTPPKGKPHAAHTCGSRACINPQHLRWASAKENSRDRKRHGTSSHKLDDEKVSIIKEAIGSYPVRHIARAFGVSVACIYAIANGKRWTHVA